MGRELTNSNTKRKNLLFLNIVACLALFASVVISIASLTILSSLDPELENWLSECETKDYSSYVEVSYYEVPGNDNINRQVEVARNAMQAAANDNDVVAFGQLYENYNRLLALQSQTSTTEEVRDYSKAEIAKTECISSAKSRKEEKELDWRLKMWVGASVFVTSAFTLACLNIFRYKYKKSRKE